MNNKIIDKIAKLLARADSGQNDNPHEREIAMRQASAMLAKHGLTMSNVTDAAERGESYGKLGRKQHTLSTRFVWESGVWASIAKLNNCQVVRTPNRGKISIWIVGRQLGCTVTQQIAEYAVNSIKREAKKQGYTVCSFGVGAWTGVNEQVERILSDRKRGFVDGVEHTKETAIMVIDSDKKALAETQTTVGDFFPRLSSGSYGYGGNRSGVSAGKSYGSKMSLNNQVSGSGGQRRIG